jgi:hypothetical protein
VFVGLYSTPEEKPLHIVLVGYTTKEDVHVVVVKLIEEE